jgi:hypothetical protein
MAQIELDSRMDSTVPPTSTILPTHEPEAESSVLPPASASTEIAIESLNVQVAKEIATTAKSTRQSIDSGDEVQFVFSVPRRRNKRRKGYAKV